MEHLIQTLFSSQIFSADTVNNGLLGIVLNFLNYIILFLQAIGGVYVVFKIVMIGLTIMQEGKDSPGALKKARDEGGGILIGLAIILLAFPLRGIIVNFISNANTWQNSNNTIDTTKAKDGADIISDDGNIQIITNNVMKFEINGVKYITALKK